MSPVSGEDQLYLAKRQNHPFPMHGDQSPVIVTCISQQLCMYVLAVLVLGSHDPSLAKLTVYCNCGHWPGHHWALGLSSLTEPSSVWISIVTTSTLPSTGGVNININTVMTSHYHLSLILQITSNHTSLLIYGCLKKLFWKTFIEGQSNPKRLNCTFSEHCKAIRYTKY